MSQVEESALSATNVPAGCIRSVLVLKTQHSTERRKTGLAALAIPLQHPSQPQAPPPPTPTTTINDAYFTILQWNANGIGNKIDELGIFMEKHKVKLTVIQRNQSSLRHQVPPAPARTTPQSERTVVLAKQVVYSHLYTCR